MFSFVSKEKQFEESMKDKVAPLEIKIKLVDPKAIIPKKATDGSAGFDLTAISEKFVQELSGPIWEYETGLAFEIPEGMVGLIFPRSSIYRTSLSLSNAVGVIDSDYRGSVSFKFRTQPPGKKYNVGDRIGQIVFVPVPEVQLVAVSELSETKRGQGSFGSTGK